MTLVIRSKKSLSIIIIILILFIFLLFLNGLLEKTKKPNLTEKCADLQQSHKSKQEMINECGSVEGVVCWGCIAAEFEDSSLCNYIKDPYLISACQSHIKEVIESVKDEKNNSYYKDCPEQDYRQWVNCGSGFEEY